MAGRYPSSAHFQSPENTQNFSPMVQAPIMPLQMFSVPPPPLPPPLPLLYPPPTFPQFYNVPSQINSAAGAAIRAQSSNIDASRDSPMSLGGHIPVPSQLINSDQASQFTKISEDESWIKDWLSRKKLLASNSKISHNTSQVCQARTHLQDIIMKFHELKLLKLEMTRQLNTMDSNAWESTLKDIQQKAVEFEASLSKFDNPRIIEELKSTLSKRSKKRASQKRRRLLHQELCNEAFGKRQQLHRSIDSWLKDMQGAVEKTKVDESLKEEADVILSDVTKKKAEARRQLALLSSLLKLHQLRVRTATSKGEHISAEHGIRFCKVSDHLKKLWEKQLKEYNLEEQGLRVMLNEAVDERDHTRVLREKLNLKQWETLLFGEKRKNIPDFYTAAENDVEAFINVRRDWDKFITSSDAPMSSAIPVGWVLPTIPSSTQWETVLSSTQSVE